MTFRGRPAAHRESRRKGHNAQTRWMLSLRKDGISAWTTGDGYDYAVDVVAFNETRTDVFQVKAWRRRPPPSVVRKALIAMRTEAPSATAYWVVWARDDGLFLVQERDEPPPQVPPPEKRRVVK